MIVRNITIKPAVPTATLPSSFSGEYTAIRINTNPNNSCKLNISHNHASPELAIHMIYSNIIPPTTNSVNIIKYI